MELTALLNSNHYERNPDRTGLRNGYYRRNLVTTAGLISDLRVPRDRAGQFQTEVFERFERYQPEVAQALAEMYFSGVSQEKVQGVAEPLLGTKPSASTISRLAHTLDQACEEWRERALAREWKVIYLDGVYFPLMTEGRKETVPLLVALGVDPSGHKEVLSLKVAGEESKAGWQNLLLDLKRRGVNGVELFVSDGRDGLIAALKEEFNLSKRQRCITHKMRNVLAHISKRSKKEVGAALSGIFNSADKEKALDGLAAFKLRYEKSYREAVKTLENEIEDCFTFFDFEPELRKYIRTTNALEGLFSTIRLRTNSQKVYQNEESLLLIVYSVIKTVEFRRLPL